MIVSIDIDEVLADYLSALLEYYNYKYKTSLKRNDFYTYNFWEIWGGTKSRAIKVVSDFHQSNYFKNIRPVAGAYWGVETLNGKCELIIISDRSHRIIEETKKWISKNFPNLFKKIYFTNHFRDNCKNTSKSEICLKLGVQILIEDTLSNAFDFYNSGGSILLLDSPWNQVKNLPDRIYRVFSWNDLICKFSKVFHILL
jgi:5'(3')-deoxyribonucleotidase